MTLYLEPVAGDKALVGILKAGPKLHDRKEIRRVTELTPWLEPLCAKVAEPPCVGQLVFRPQSGPIEDTIALLSAVLQSKPLADTPPAIRFESGCGFDPTKDRAADPKGPWGPRSPDRPCFGG